MAKNIENFSSRARRRRRREAREKKRDACKKYNDCIKFQKDNCAASVSTTASGPTTTENFTVNTCETNCETFLIDGATVQNCTNTPNSNQVDGKTVGIIFGVIFGIILLIFLIYNRNSIFKKFKRKN